MNTTKDSVEGGVEERRRAMRNAFTPMGLLPNKVSFLTKELDRERCYELEKRTAFLLNHILPKPYSEQHRNSVVSYLQCLIMNSVPCQVFTFGSVPLKTYLPDGDIDLTVFGCNRDLKDSLVHEVRGVLESERNNKDAEFLVKEICYIEGQVKILKCIVDKFVVDISFNQISGLCALCFFEEVDNLISNNHLFKRSLILIKAWCFHESRILGASHGLISTYALEVLVLYIFHIYNHIFPFSGPFEVLFRFLNFFSKFDWNNYIVSLSGPIPISSLPNMMAELPRNDCGELLLKGEVLNVWKAFYGVTPRREGPFVSKHWNILDPLCENNNLGRSISKGNFYRIQSAMALGAERLMRLFDCTEEKIITEFDYFFQNIWNRHVSGCWVHFQKHNLILRNNTLPVNVMNASNLPVPSPPPPPLPGLPPPPPPPLPGFPPPPPPPGFGHANSSSWNNTSGTSIVTSNVQDMQLSAHVKRPMNLIIPSWCSPGSSQRIVDNPRPTFPPTMTYVPLNHMHMNADPTNLNNTSSVTNYSSLGATSNPCFVRVVVHDILKADFLSHLMNLKLGRLCENPQLQWHFPYLPSPIVPPFHYPREVASITHSNFMNNMPQLPPPPPPHRGFDRSVKKRRARKHKRSGGIGTSLIDQKKMSDLSTKNEASSHASLDDTQAISDDGTNEASSQSQGSQSVSNEIENVEGDSAVPSSHQPPTTDSPRTQDEHVSTMWVFSLGSNVCIFYECVKGILQCR